MPKGKKWKWFSKEELQHIAAQHTSLSSIARELGVSKSTFIDHLDARGYKDEVYRSLNEGIDLNLKHDVLSKEGREGYARDSELKSLRKEAKRLQKAVFDQEAALERFVEASNEPRVAPGFEFRSVDGPKKRDAILHMSDWHYGQLVLPESTAGGVNFFNRDVFEQRLGKYVDSVCATLEDFSGAYTLENLIFALGGDMVEGYGVFEGQEWHLWEDPMVQVVNACDLYSAAMHEIMGVAIENCGVKNVSVMAVPGNHGKPGGRKAGATPSTYSYDWLLYKLLEKELKNYPIFNYAIEPAGECYFVSQEHTFSMHHGDEIRGWAGLPFYGIARHDAKTIRTNHVINDYALLGHHHQQAEIPVGYGIAYISGNAVGPNNLKRFVGGGPASQRLLFVSKEHGAAWPLTIYLQSKEERLIRPTVHEVG